MPAFKIKEVTDPKFMVEFPGQSEPVPFDPWKVQEDIERFASEAPADSPVSARIYDAIRRAFGLPVAADVEAGTAVYFGADTPPADKPGTFTRNQALEIQLALGEFVEGLPISKKASALGRSSSDSSASPSPNSKR
jgi:hypothetical protein